METGQIDRVAIRAQRVLESLDRWDERLNGHQTERRERDRAHIRGTIAIAFPESDFALAGRQESDYLRVWARNISQSGVGFIYNGIIHAEYIIARLNCGDEEMHFQARIIRRRQLPEDFWEYGAELLERIDG